MWLRIEHVGKSEYRLHVRTWHPSFWAFVYRKLRDCGASRTEAAWLVLDWVARQCLRRKQC